MGEIALLEDVCKQLYTTNDQSQRKEAEKAIVSVDYLLNLIEMRLHLKNALKLYEMHWNCLIY